VLSPQGEVLPDLETKLPGRGAYTCTSAACLAAACRQRQFSRAFKREVLVAPPEEMVASVANLLRERILGYIGLANRSGKIISGGSLVSDAIRGSHKPGLVLVATDVSDAIGARIETLAGVNRVPCVSIMTKDDFGAILGKAPRSAVAVRSGGFVKQLAGVIERYRNFLGEVQVP
jgi:ribosomal protein L7Ae-like RNA K-turn-binding protein